MRTLALIVGLIAAQAMAFAQAHDIEAPVGIDLAHLPLGDGHVSDAPGVGTIWACHIDGKDGGPRRNGPWIRDDGTYDLTAKSVVGGAVNWPAQFTVTQSNGTRVFATNDLPAHPTGIFPVRVEDPAYRNNSNPNHIAAHDIRLELPATPELAPQPNCAPGAVGILLSGAVLFSALDAMGRDAVAHEVQDACQGHPQVSGVYHYHNLTHCQDDARLANGHSALVGYALDGFGIFGPFDAGGKALKSADLDACHGHTHAIPWDGKTVVMYHYHATWDFPYTVGCMRGPVNKGTVLAIGGGPPGGKGPHGLPNLDTAAARLGIAVARLKAALGPPPPDLQLAAAQLGIPQQTLRQALENAR